VPSAVIIGGGYAGVQAARRLSALLAPSWSITLVDRNTCHQLITRLPQILGGQTAPDRACIPFSRVLDRRVSVLQTQVKSIDPTTEIVRFPGGTLTADWALISCGSAPDYHHVPGAARYTHTFKSVDDAAALRRVIHSLCASKSVVQTAIVGAGYTATEVAGTLADWNRRLLKRHAAARIHVHIVAPDERLLPEGDERLGQIAASVLRAKGVTLSLGIGVKRVYDDHLRLSSGLAVEADVVVWAARSRSSAPVGDGWNRGDDGRLMVDPYLRAMGHSHIFCAGDAALAYDFVRGRIAPASAQLAVQEGRLAAENIAAQIDGRRLKEFRPIELGEALSLGEHDGVARLGALVLRGRAGAAVKQAALIRYLAGLGGSHLLRRYS
jgi:NADH:ubiquinone reductase (H+-translocating)